MDKDGQAIREIKCLLALGDLTPRTQNKSLLNIKLDERKQALTLALSWQQQLADIKRRCGEGEIIKIMDSLRYEKGERDLGEMLRGEDIETIASALSAYILEGK